MRRISVVLPVYNESESIVPCLRGLAAALEGVDHEILVCHDTDEDTTLPAIAAMADRPASVRLVKNTLGRGALQAIRAGFAAAQGDVVVTTMADLSDPPGQILPMAEKIRDGADVVSGSRYMPGGSQRGGPWLKRTLSRIAGVSLRWITGIGTHDATSNFRAYSSAFLKDVAIESRAGFEIALELTVKAHLAGRRVDEVPSSWVERSSGKSNFRLWKWLPSYLRWYLRAARVPALLWILAIAGAALWIARPQAPEVPMVVHRMTAVLLAVGAIACLAFARSFRGRSRLVDAAHLAIWLHPWHASLLGGPLSVIDVAASAAASALLLGKLDLRNLAVTAIAAVIWLVHAVAPYEAPSQGLDVSWSAALDQAAIRGLRAGVDYVFTFGPLGFLGTRAYTAELFWTKLLAWQGVLLLGLTILLVRTALRIRSPIERAIFLLLLVVPTAPDAYANVLILGVAAWVLGKETFRLGSAWPAVSVLAFLALSKFSLGISASVCAAAIIFACARRVSLRSAAGLAAGFVLALGIAWWTAGQKLTDFPTWLRRSLELSSGYSEACATAAPPGTVELGIASISLFGLMFVLRRPAPALALAGLGVLWIAFKGGFVRASDHTMIFFGFALVAAYLFAPARGSARRESKAGPMLRAACAVIGMAGVAATSPEGWTGWIARSGKMVARQAGQFAAPERLEARTAEFLAGMQAKWSLPRTRSAVGDRTIDFVSYRQGMLFLNDLEWHPRPVFQGYLTFSPELMETNARFLAGDRAPEFVLFRLDSIDRHLPAMEDARSLQVLARDYEPVLAERGCLLLRRHPRPDAGPTPEVQLDRRIRFGERVDLSGLSGSCHVLYLDVAPTLAGRARTLLLKAPEVEMEVGLASGDTVRFRIVPGMMRAGVILDPLLRNQADWLAWATGGQLLHPAWIRVLEPEAPGCYRDGIGVKIVRDDGIAPIQKPELARESVLAGLRTLPTEARSSAPPRLDVLRGEDVVVLPAPSELRFEVLAGKHVLAARYGILAWDWKKDGATFRALLVGPDGKEIPLFEDHLDPVAVEIDQRLKYLRVPFDAQTTSTLVLRAEPGPGEEAPSREVVWAEIEIR